MLRGAESARLGLIVIVPLKHSGSISFSMSPFSVFAAVAVVLSVGVGM